MKHFNFGLLSLDSTPTTCNEAQSYEWHAQCYLRGINHDIEKYMNTENQLCYAVEFENLTLTREHKRTT